MSEEQSQEWTPELLEKLGKFMGMLADHGITDVYVVGSQPTQRPIGDVRQEIRDAQIQSEHTPETSDD